MRRIQLWKLIILIAILSACSQTQIYESSGEDVTDEFITKYSGTYNEQSQDTGESVTLWSDKEIEIHQHRQVHLQYSKHQNSPVFCSYTLRGQVEAVIQLDQEGRQRTTPQGETYLTPETHNLIFKVEDVELNNDLRRGTVNNKHCQKFQRQMQESQPVFSYGMELYDDGTIRFHTFDDGLYPQQGRNESTLDEVFIRE